MRRMVEIGEGHMPSLPKSLLLRLCSRYQYRPEFSCYLVDTSFCSLTCLLPWTIYLFSTAKTAIWLVRVNSALFVTVCLSSDSELAAFHFFFFFSNLKFTAFIKRPRHRHTGVSSQKTLISIRSTNVQSRLLSKFSKMQEQEGDNGHNQAQ